MADFNELVNDSDYQALDDTSKYQARRAFLQQHVAKDPDYQSLDDATRQKLTKSILFPEGSDRPAASNKNSIGSTLIESAKSLVPFSKTLQGQTSDLSEIGNDLLPPIVGDAFRGGLDLIRKIPSVHVPVLGDVGGPETAKLIEDTMSNAPAFHGITGGSLKPGLRAVAPTLADALESSPVRPEREASLARREVPITAEDFRRARARSEQGMTTLNDLLKSERPVEDIPSSLHTPEQRAALEASRPTPFEMTPEQTKTSSLLDEAARQTRPEEGNSTLAAAQQNILRGKPDVPEPSEAVRALQGEQASLQNGEIPPRISVMELARRLYEEHGAQTVGEADAAANGLRSANPRDVGTPEYYERLPRAARSQRTPEDIARESSGEELSGLGRSLPDFRTGDAAPVERSALSGAKISDAVKDFKNGASVEEPVRAVEEAPKAARTVEPGAKVSEPETGVVPNDPIKKLLTSESGELNVGAVVEKINSVLDRTLTDKQLGRADIREKAGEYARKKEMARHELDAASKEFDNASIPESAEFIHAAETGASQKILPHQELWNKLHEMLNDRLEKIQGLGVGALDHWIENYFPHLWAKPGEVARAIGAITGRRPLAGPASFLKQRSMPTFQDGINAGLEPVTYNPVKAVLLRLNEMDRFIMAHEMKDTFIEHGLARLVKDKRKVPAGWLPLNDNIFQRGLAGIHGRYYAPAEVATSFNNYMSPGLRGNLAFDAAMKVGNVMNQFQLGLSAFHAGFVAVDSVTSDLSLAIQKASRGDLAGAVKPAARAFVSPWSLVDTYRRGAKGIAEYLEPGKYTELSRQVEALADANGRVFQDPFYRNQAIDNFWKAWKEGNVTNTALRAPGAAMELLAKPIMEKLVPKMKVGTFMKLAEDVLSRSDVEGWTRDKTRVEMNKAWDSVDNRLGQVVYDNLFWNKAIKDLGLVSTRSLGWNAGTVREIGGGLKDIGSEAARAATGNGYEGLSTRASYVVALPIMVGFLGAVYSVLMTGKAPQSLSDYYFIKTGKKDASGHDERVSLPSYMKDVFGFSRAPVQTALHKVHPLISSVADMLQNQDFYGNEIANSRDPLVKQWADRAKFAGEQFLPFSVRNAQQRAKNVGESGVTSLFKPEELPGTIQSAIGITPAPRYTTQTDAEKLASDRLTPTLPRGPRTAEQAAKTEEIQRLENRYRLGKATKADLQKEFQGGKITSKDFSRIVGEANTPALPRITKRLSLPDALDVYDAATPEEKKILKNVILRKQESLDNFTGERRQELIARIRKVRIGK